MAIPTVSPTAMSLARTARYLVLILAAAFASQAASALDSGSIIVTSIKGEVHFTASGATRSLKAGSALDLPATIRTGKDGSVDLTQGATTVSVGPDTQLEFPAPEKPNGPIDRIVQPKGNAFYDIGKRDGRKLRIDTPYLVGVIKGTQFNVTAQPDSTTISLFEGRLEVLSAKDGETVDLKAGEIASLKAGEKSIAVMKMDGKLPRKTSTSKLLDGDLSLVAAADNGSAMEPDINRVMPGSSSTLNVGVHVRVETGLPDLPAGGTIPLPPAPSVDLDVDTGVSTPVDTGVPDAPTPPVDTGVPDAPAPPVDLGAGNIDVDVDLGLDDDDGNNGHGNDDDHDDSSNPGRGRGRGHDDDHDDDSRNRGPGNRNDR